MCRHCRATDLTVTEVSGLAQLIGFTIAQEGSSDPSSW
jgi:hypothetical protein